MTEAEQENQRAGGIHIVLAAKQSEVRASLERTLHQSRLGHSLTVVGGADELLDHLGVGSHRQDPVHRDAPARMPNLIICGFDENGAEDERVMQAIKGDPKLRPIPLIALVGRGNRARTRALYAMGASSVIQLPLHFSDLVDIMRVLEAYWGRTVRLPRRPR